MERGVERHHLRVDPRARAVVADFAVDGVREIDGRGVFGQGDDLALRREHQKFVGVQLGFERLHEVFGVFEAALPVEHFADPRKALGKGGVFRLFFFVFPVRRDTEFGDAVHFERSDLNFERLPEVGDDRCVQRLVHIRLGRGDVVFDAPRNGFPLFVNLAQHFVTLVYRADDDAHRREVVDLVERFVLRFHLFIDGIKVLGTAEHFALDFAFVEDAFDLFDDEIDEIVALVQFLVNVFHQKFVRFRL